MMGAYLLKRLLQGIFVIWLVTLVVFVIIHLAPGDPILIMLGGQDVPPEQIELIRTKWGLNEPIPVQYLRWLGNILQGDFGESITHNGLPVISLIRNRLPNTVKLNLLAYLLALAIAIPSGVISAVRQYTVFDYGAGVFSMLGIAMPNFWIALMLLVVFSLKLGLLPTFGMMSWKSYLLPCISLGIAEAAIIVRFTRSNVLEILREDFVRTARAKGLSERVVLLQHVLRNASLALVTLIGYRMAHILSGTVIIETVFAWPGIGRLAVDCVFRRDYMVVQAIAFLSAVFVLAANLITDILYTYLDPRVSITRRGTE